MITFTIKGVPRPQARPRLCQRRSPAGHPWDKKRGFLSRYGRRVTKVYSPKTDWFQYVYSGALQSRPKTPLKGPLYLQIIFRMYNPKQLKKGTIWHTKRPDLDNIEKAVMDACTKAKLWHDDSQVCQKYTEKRYGDDMGITVYIIEKEQEDVDVEIRGRIGDILND